MTPRDQQGKISSALHIRAPIYTHTSTPEKHFSENYCYSEKNILPSFLTRRQETGFESGALCSCWKKSHLCAPLSVTVDCQWLCLSNTSMIHVVSALAIQPFSSCGRWVGRCDCGRGEGTASSAGLLFLFSHLWFLEKIVISPELAILFIPPGPSHLFSNLGRLFTVTWQPASWVCWLMHPRRVWSFPWSQELYLSLYANLKEPEGRWQVPLN